MQDREYTIGLRPYKKEDAEMILSWCPDEESFYKWTAGVLGTHPITERQFSSVEANMPFVAFDESGPVGFFMLRKPGTSLRELRFGFVIVDPRKRGKGYGKAMLQKGLQYAFEIYGAQTVTLGVFENNPGAYYCYKAVGFEDLEADEVYHVMGQDWRCRELKIESSTSQQVAQK